MSLCNLLHKLGIALPLNSKNKEAGFFAVFIFLNLIKMITNQIQGVRELTAQECMEINGGGKIDVLIRWGKRIWNWFEAVGVIATVYSWFS